MTRVAFRWYGDRGKAKAATARALHEAAQHLLGEARRLVPIEEGTLERSGHAQTDGERAAVSFDGPYAVRQHEDLTYAHDPGRQAKYLEQPMQTERAVVRALLAAALDRGLR